MTLCHGQLQVLNHELCALDSSAVCCFHKIEMLCCSEIQVLEGSIK